jgi:hypothetical protein
MKWLLVFTLLTGNTSNMMTMKDLSASIFKTEAECKDTQQELLRDPKFIDMMFKQAGMLVPTCIEVSDAQIEMLKKGGK